MTRASGRLSLATLGWAAALLPLVAAHAAYLLSAADGRVPWCLPYLDGCTSISRAARAGAANPLFKALMLPYSVVLALFWWRAAQDLDAVAPQRRRTIAALPGLGLVAALATAIYALALGIDGEFYQWMRRYGITLSFAFTVLAQMLLAAALSVQPRIPRAGRHALVALCAALLALGLASLPLQHLALDRDAAVNAIEWSYSLLMIAFFPLSGALLRAPAREVAP